MTVCDTSGRPYAKYSELKVGDVVVVDDGFTCMGRWQKRVVYECNGELTIKCKSNHHGLQGQLDFDDNDSLVGIYNQETIK